MKELGLIFEDKYIAGAMRSILAAFVDSCILLRSVLSVPASASG